MASAAPPAPPRWPDQTIHDQANPLGILSIPLLLEQRRWIHRQVDTVEFIDERRLLYRTSVDFTVPPLVPVLTAQAENLALIPIGLVKKGPFRHFDLRDEADVALPLLTREQNGTIAAAALIALGDLIVSANSQSLDPHIRTELIDIAQKPTDEAWKNLQSLSRQTGLGSHQQRGWLWAHDYLRALATDLATKFVMFVPMHARPGDRRVVKYMYETFRESKGMLVSQRLGLKKVQLGFIAFGLGAAESYHFEIAMPQGLLIESARLYRQEAPPQPPTLLDQEHFVLRAHLQQAGMPRDARGRVGLDVRLRPDMVRVSYYGALFTTALLLTGLVLHAWGVHPSPDALTALIIVLPGIFAVYLAAPGEHPMVQRLVAGLRFSILGSALILFVAAGSLAVTLRSSHRTAIWMGLVILSLANLAVMGLALWLSNGADKRSKTG